MLTVNQPHLSFSEIISKSVASRQQLPREAVDGAPLEVFKARLEL